MYLPTKPSPTVYVLLFAPSILVPFSIEFVSFEYHSYVNVHPAGTIASVFAVNVSPYLFVPSIVTLPVISAPVTVALPLFVLSVMSLNVAEV